MKSRKLANGIVLPLPKHDFLIRWGRFLLLPLVFFLMGGTLSAQNSSSITIKGVVYDKLNKPLQGVTVEIVGTRKGVATDEQGKFTITIDNAKQQLRFSHVGYVAQATSINNSLSLEIFMDAEVGSQNEVVVVGYGKQRKISQIGAQSQQRLLGKTSVVHGSPRERRIADTHSTPIKVGLPGCCAP